MTLSSGPNRLFKKLVTIAISCAAVLLLILSIWLVGLPLFSKLRWYQGVNRFLSEPGMRKRLTLEPTEIALKTPAQPVHPVNLGYAIFDTGLSDALQIEAAGSTGSVIAIKAPDWSVVLMAPTMQDKTGSAAPLSSQQTRELPHFAAFVHLEETDFITAEIQVEQTQVLPWTKAFRLRKDDALLYTTCLTQKAQYIGTRKVGFFSTATARGVIRIVDEGDRGTAAYIHLSSADRSKGVGGYLRLSPESHREIAKTLEPILRSFHFTVQNIGTWEETGELIRQAGIPRKATPPPE
jgi:hypothetical protein